jgi:hypothetical protein
MTATSKFNSLLFWLNLGCVVFNIGQIYFFPENAVLYFALGLFSVFACVICLQKDKQVENEKNKRT